MSETEIERLTRERDAFRTLLARLGHRTEQDAEGRWTIHEHPAVVRLQAIRAHVVERMDGDCNGDNAQWDGGFKAACSQVLALLDAPYPDHGIAERTADGVLESTRTG